MENSDQLTELTKIHFQFLKNFTTNQINDSKNLTEYYQYLSNEFDSVESYKNENKKLNKIKLNEKIFEQQQQQNKLYNINWNLDYCEYCKLSYWPDNCTVYIVPKYRMNHNHAKLNSKLKLFDYKPKYKSYKDNLIKRIINRGIELIYECKRCKSKNVLVNELKRKNLKCIKLTKKLNEIKFKQDLKKSKFKFNTNKLEIEQTELKSELKSNETTNTVNKAKNFAIKKKFQSLQLKLKQNEIEQERLKNQTKSSFGNLADFLQKLT